MNTIISSKTNQTINMQAKGKVLPDLEAEKRLATARAKFETAKPETKQTVMDSHHYETVPDVIAYTFTPKRGPNKGKNVEVKSIGFRSLANPASSYLAVKLKVRDVLAVLACCDAGHRQELEDLIKVYAEISKTQEEED